MARQRFKREGSSIREAILKELDVFAFHAWATRVPAELRTKFSFFQEWDKLIVAAKKEIVLVLASGHQPSCQYRLVLDMS
jgi:hypothetical protein